VAKNTEHVLIYYLRYTLAVNLCHCGHAEYGTVVVNPLGLSNSTDVDCIPTMVTEILLFACDRVQFH
jgi:hypothetical protein